MSKKQKTTSEPTLAPIFSRKLVELRKSRQFTQHELAEKMGVTRTQISHWESASPNPTLESIERVAAFFNVTPLSFLEDSEDKEKDGRTSRLDQQVSKIKFLSAHKQRMITNMLEAALNTN